MGKEIQIDGYESPRGFDVSLWCNPAVESVILRPTECAYSDVEIELTKDDIMQACAALLKIAEEQLP